MLRVVGIAGYKEAGKTKVVEGLVKELVDRGYSVGTVKHVPKGGFTLDRPGTDTWRHAQAGSEMVVCLSPEELAILERRKADMDEVLLKMLDLDFAVLEGFRESEGLAKIMVARSDGEAVDLADEFTVGFIGHGTGDRPVLKRGDFSALADLVEKRAIPPVGGLDCGACDYSSCRDFALAAIIGDAPKDGCSAITGGVKLIIDGERVPLNPFVQNLIASTLAGMLSALEGGKGKKIDLEVTRSEG
ncbi:hypothetical protein AKJ45_02610 [candidate division MSBL1 archaeon SCGC-AAA261F19]|uniref:4Fe-4S domain-containing protein n=1 Tax=candidate division MSBL1 archaeon SCGC-AAA261F19 TaxID=1698275 RepID=A0A133V9I6_9EURY|nr:hypothetical protein AKJ45_02610 [candidate division MSBL1 archaeon SCGC-AAA261F19]